MMNNELALYAPFIKEIKALIYRRQYEALKKVNTELLQLYWEIGGKIEQKQREQGWGKSVVEVLAKELKIEFPGVQGYSTRNLWLMRSFYLEYSQGEILQPLAAELKDSPKIDKKSHSEILQPMVAELKIVNLPPLVADVSWTKNVVIMQKCKDPLERIFYIKATRRFGWSKDVLINNIENKAFERYLTNQTNFDDAVPEKYRLQAKLAVKDEYNFDFLEMGTEHSEAELEAAIIKNIRAFLEEMGDHFTFVRDQYPLPVSKETYHVDILLFHRQLQSLIAIDLKIGSFTPEYAGKMQFYLTVLDETKKLPHENSSIGIVICKDKDRTIVEYALKSSDKPIGVATYDIHKNLPESLRSLLPSPDEIAKIVHRFDDDAKLIGLTDSAPSSEDK